MFQSPASGNEAGKSFYDLSAVESKHLCNCLL